MSSVNFPFELKGTFKSIVMCVQGIYYVKRPNIKLMMFISNFINIPI